MTDAALDPAAAATTWRALFAEDGGDPLEACKDAPPLAEAISAGRPEVPQHLLEGRRERLPRRGRQAAGPVGREGAVRRLDEAGALQEVRRGSKARPDDAFFQDLDDHRIASTRKPRIELRYGAVKVADLDFEIELALKVKGVRLEVRGGKLVRATAGVFAAAAKLSLHDQVLVEKGTPEFSAPTRMRFS